MAYEPQKGFDYIQNQPPSVFGYSNESTYGRASGYPNQQHFTYGPSPQYNIDSTHEYNYGSTGYNSGSNYRTNIAGGGYGGGVYGASGYDGLAGNNNFIGGAVNHHKNEDPGYNYNPHDYLTSETSFEVRKDFISKVFTIVTIQLLVTFGISAIPAFSMESKLFFLESTGGIAILAVCTCVFFVVFIVALCFSSVLRKYPWNYVMLTLLTLSMSGIISYSAAYSDPFSFLLAVGATSLISFSLIMFAKFTKWDFTGWGPYLLVVSIIVLVFAIVAIFWKNKIYHLVISSILALLFSIYIVYDAQLIYGGKSKKYQYGIDEYAFAAMSLYLDIVNLFLALLSIIDLAQG